MDFDLVLDDESSRERALAVSALSAITEVNTDGDARRADNAVKGAKTFVKVVHDQRMAISRKVDAVKKQLIAREDEICADVNKELQRVQKLCGDYVTAQSEAKAAEAERAEALGETVQKSKPVDGVKAREYWGFRIVDAFAVPREYCKPDEVAIRSMLDAAKRNGAEIASVKMQGVEFYKEFRV